MTETRLSILGTMRPTPAVRPKLASSSRFTQNPRNNPRVAGKHGEQHAGWPFGLAAALFPVAQGGGGDADLPGKAVLGRAGFLADRGNVYGWKMVHAQAGDFLPLCKGAGFGNARHQAVKINSIENTHFAATTPLA
jgi:hypothetical protein